MKEHQAILAATHDLPKLQSIGFHGFPITNAELHQFQRFRSLRSLCLESSKIREGNCDGLRGLQLTWLSVARSRFDDRGLAALQDMKTLEHLDITRSKVTDAGLVHIEGLTNLKMLRLNRSLVTKAGYENLQKKLPGCTIRWAPLVKP